MTIRKPKNGRATSTAQGLMTGLAVNMVVTLIAAAILAKMIETEILAWQNVGYAIIPTLVFASFTGAYTACQRIKRQNLGISFLSGLLYWIALIAATALFYGGKYEAVVVTASLILAGCFIAFFCITPKTTRRRSRKNKVYTR